MPTIPRSQNHLAELLGIAKSAMSLQVHRGCPTDTLENAQAWRKANLDPARRKGQRQPALPPEHTLAAQASALMDAASALLESDQTIEALMPSLRAALHAVPPPQRDDVGLRLDVVKLMVADVLALCPADKDALCDDGSPAYLDRDMTDSEAQEMGEFWYQVAAGEWLVA